MPLVKSDSGALKVCVRPAFLLKAKAEQVSVDGAGLPGIAMDAYMVPSPSCR